MRLAALTAVSVLYPVITFRTLLLFSSQGPLPGLIGFPLILVPTTVLWYSAGRAWNSFLVVNSEKLTKVMAWSVACLSVADLAYALMAMPRMTIGSHMMPPALWLMMYGVTSGAFLGALRRGLDLGEAWVAPAVYLVVMGTFMLYNPYGMTFAG